jgi:hypothetical protein
MSDDIADKEGISLGLALWGVAALLLIFFVVGASGLIHLAVWILVIAIIFAIAFAGVALVMRVFAG